MKKFNDEQLSRVLSHVGEMPSGGAYGRQGPGCLVQTAFLVDNILSSDDWGTAGWFDHKGGARIKEPDELLRALESRGLA